MRIWVTMKHSPNVQKNIDEKDFDEITMTKVPPETKESKEKSIMVWNDIIKSKTAPGIISSRKNSTPSLTHKGKLDSGSVENLLDVGLEGAKKRALKRNKNYGKSFIKNRKVANRRKK